MENNIATLYILQRESAKIFNYFRPFCPKNIKNIKYSYIHRIATVT